MAQRLWQKLATANKGRSEAELAREYERSYAAQERYEVEQFEEEYRLFFETPRQLVETINRLEEGNLTVIQQIQENEQNLLDTGNKMNVSDSEKNQKIAALTATRDDLRLKIKALEDEVRTTQRRAETMEKEKFHSNVEKIRAALNQISATFKADFDKGESGEGLKDADEKRSLIATLSQLEGIVYKYSLAIKREDPTHVYKLVSSSEKLPRQPAQEGIQG